MKDIAQNGFTYTLETFVDNVRDDNGALVELGRCVDTEVVHNIMPVEGINHVLEVALRNATQTSTWYLLLFENDYAPQPTDKMATFPALAGEVVTYTDATRQPIVFSPAVGGQCGNVDNRNMVEFTATKTIKGGALCSSPSKGTSGGILLSAVQFTSPKFVDLGAILRVTAGIGLSSD